MENAYETRSDSNMKMYVDLCFDAFEENRDKRWGDIWNKLNADPYWKAREKPKPKEPEPVVVEEVKKKSARPARPLRKKKVAAAPKSLEDRLFFSKKTERE